MDGLETETKKKKNSVRKLKGQGKEWEGMGSNPLGFWSSFSQAARNIFEFLEEAKDSPRENMSLGSKLFSFLTDTRRGNIHEKVT